MIHDDTDGVPIYLAGDSAYNMIHADVRQTSSGGGKREVIAIDASAFNTISNNWLTGWGYTEEIEAGGIYLYRACIDGTVVYTTPSYNTISGNKFFYKDDDQSEPAVWIGERTAQTGGACGLNAYDYAVNNIVADNYLCNRGDISTQFKVSLPGVNTGNSLYGNQGVGCLFESWITSIVVSSGGGGGGSCDGDGRAC